MRSFLVCFSIGGAAYVLIELMWRRRSHVSMFIVGGLCFAMLDAIFQRYRPPLLLACLIGSALITAMEFVSGYVVNMKLGLGVWDYSRRPGNLYGQVCVGYSLLWCALSLLVFALSSALHSISWLRL